MTTEKKDKTNFTKERGASMDLPIGDVTYTMSPLELGDFADFEAWLRNRQVKEILAIKDIDPTRQTDLINHALDRIISLMEIVDVMQSMSGMVHTLYLAARRNHKDLKEEEIAKQLKLTDVSRVLDIVMKLGQPAGDDNSKNQEEGKTKKA